MGTHLRVTQRKLSNEYQHDRVSLVFKNLCILVHWTKVASPLDGLIVMGELIHTDMLSHTCYGCVVIDYMFHGSPDEGVVQRHRRLCSLRHSEVARLPVHHVLGHLNEILGLTVVGLKVQDIHKYWVIYQL